MVDNHMHYQPKAIHSAENIDGESVQSRHSCYAEDIRRLESGLYGLTKGRCSRRDATSFGKTRQDLGVGDHLDEIPKDRDLR